MDSRRDLLMALSVVALGIFVMAIAQTIHAGIYRDAVGPRAFPLAIGVLFIVNGGIVAVQRLRNMNAGRGYLVAAEGTEDEAEYPASAMRAAFVIVLTFAYAAAFQPLGYLLATPLYVVAALAAMSERRWLVSVGIAVVWTIATYVIFAQGLAVRMPVGPLRSVFRAIGWI